METEEILAENPNRFTLFPVVYEKVWKMYERARDSFWVPAEVNLAKDISDWKLLTDDERHFIKYVLGFFSSSDGIVLENLATNFYREVQIPEARQFYAVQMAMEAVHAEMYGILIDVFVTDVEEKKRIFNAVNHYPEIGMKANWALRWISSDRPFAERLIAFAVVEGIFFSGSFCALFWLKKRKLMPGLTFSNELINRDESLHCDFACLLFSLLKPNSVPESTAHQIFFEAVTIEKQFVTSALPVHLIGMNADLMCQYIEYVADNLLACLGYGAIFGSSNPFDFMTMMVMDGKTNFFERRVGEYKKKKKDDVVSEIDFDNEDF